MESIYGVNVHPLASVFPLLEGEERDRMLVTFKEKGFIDELGPVIFDQDGLVIDGRNRLSVCEELGIEYSWTKKHFDSDSERMNFIIAANIERRQLTTSQRSMLAADMATWVNGQNQHTEKVGGHKCTPTSNEEAADAMKVSSQSVKNAKKVKAKGTPELQDAVRNGSVAVTKAASIASLPKEEQNEAVEAVTKPKPKAKPKAKPKTDTTVSPFKQDVARLLAKGKMTENAFWKEVRMSDCSSGTANAKKNQKCFLTIVHEVIQLKLLEHDSGHMELTTSENTELLKELYATMSVLHKAVKSNFRFDVEEVRIQSRKAIELLTPYV